MRIVIMARRISVTLSFWPRQLTDAPHVHPHCVVIVWCTKFCCSDDQ